MHTLIDTKLLDFQNSINELKILNFSDNSISP